SYTRDGLLFPQREFRGRWDGPVGWGRMRVRLANRILHNPFYAGAYFYGRQRAVTTLDPATQARKTVLQELPLESWEVLIRDAHPAYICWEEFAGNEKRLKENWCMPGGGMGSARSGQALLQGLAHCGRCGRRMGVRYWGRHSSAAYICARFTETAKAVYCSCVPAARVDRWVEERILEAIRPVGIEAALAAVEELEQRGEDLRRQWKQRIEQAEYEAGLARRRYEAVDPDNRLVAANLERNWEEKLCEVESLRKEYEERTGRPPMRISEEERRRLHELSRDLPRLWRAKTTKWSDRKRVLRLLLRDVWLSQQDDPRRTRVQLHWQTGAVSEGQVERPWPIGHRFKTPERAVQRVRELVAQDLKPREVAEVLNREGLETGRGLCFNRSRVGDLLRQLEFSRRKQEAEQE
ncbi:MAG: recombinase family protein, partial [Candidatus Methylomirabilis sp.]